MKDFIKKVIEGNGIKPPDNCLEAFNHNFIGAINVDWFNRSTYIEAIFYKDNLEQIAAFDMSGSLISYKQFIPKEFLPEAIKMQLETKGEIMNSVLINKGNSIEYEAIIRDNKLIRFVVLLTDLGKVIDEKRL